MLLIALYVGMMTKIDKKINIHTHFFVLIAKELWIQIYLMKNNCLIEFAMNIILKLNILQVRNLFIKELLRKLMFCIELSCKSIKMKIRSIYQRSDTTDISFLIQMKQFWMTIISLKDNMELKISSENKKFIMNN